MIKIAITKGRIEKQVCKLLQQQGFDMDPIFNKDRELLIETKDGISMIFAKANDVLTFLEHGIVDVGFVGKDTLDESDFDDYYEFLYFKATLFTTILVEISEIFSITSRPLALSVDPVSTISTIASDKPTTGPNSTEPSSLIISTSSCLDAKYSFAVFVYLEVIRLRRLNIFVRYSG